MPTNNGPMPPACPYVGANINLDSSKEKLVTTISSQSRQEITMPTNPMPPACPYVGGEHQPGFQQRKAGYDHILSK